MTSMRFTISGRNIEVTQALRDAVEAKIGKLERYFMKDTEANVVLSVEKGRQKIEVTIPVKGGLIRAEETNEDMYSAIDLVEDVIERQLKKYKNKLVDKRKNGGDFQHAFLEEAVEEEEEIRIGKVKRFEIKPMYVEDACVQMDLLGHSFYVFINAETDQVNVVYRRKKGDYGLIEPEY